MMLELFNFLYLYFLSKRRLSQFPSRVALDTWQKKKLQNFYKFLAKSPFYKDFDQNNLEIIDKKTWMSNFINTRGIKIVDAQNLALNAERTRDFSEKLDDVSVGLSTGTSGNRGLFLVSDKERMFWAANILAKTLDKGLFVETNIAFFLRADNNLYQSLSKSRKINFQFFDLLKDLDLHIDRLNQLEVDILVGPASLLKILAQIQEKGDLNLNPRKIISVAEVLEDKDKYYIEKVFSKRVDQIYQATEGFLAFTCKSGHLHLNEDLIYFEKEWLDQEHFVPIITDFTRKTQPIVRYRLNDILKISIKKDCACGSQFTQIERVIGRSDDILYVQSKKDSKPKNLFPDYVSRIIVNSFDQIEDYRVKQTALNKLEISLEIDLQYLKEASLQIKSSFEDYCLSHDYENFELDINNKKIDLDKTKKLRRVIREFKL